MTTLKNGIQAHEFSIMIVPQMRHIVAVLNLLF